MNVRTPAGPEPRHLDRTRHILSHAVLALACGCGGTAVDDRNTRTGPRAGPTGPAVLRVLVAPTKLFDAAGAPHDRGQVVGRNGGFDFLAGYEAGGVTARRAYVRGARLAFDGEQQRVISDARNYYEVSTNGDQLALCHNRFDADPIHFSVFTGAYEGGVRGQLWASASLCDGVAFREAAGMIAVHKRAPDGRCCSSAWVVDVAPSGTPTSEERLALPEGNFDDVSLTAYPRGFAWAGYADSTGTVNVTFAPEGEHETTVEIPDENAGTRPKISPWPFGDDAIAVSWQATDTRSRVVVVNPSGTVLVDHLIDRPEERWVSRPEITSFAGGLVVAWGECPPYEAEDDEGEVVVAVLGSDGAVRDSNSFPGCSRPDVAADDEHIVVMLADELDSYRAAVLELVVP